MLATKLISHTFKKDGIWYFSRRVPADSEFAFPNFKDGARTNANSASAALNKWLKMKIAQDYTIHSFRHSMRDRLRSVECPSEVIDQIGGLLTHGVGNSYGLGHPLSVMQGWMIELVDNKNVGN